MSSSSTNWGRPIRPVRRRLVQGRPPWNRLQDSSSPEVVAHLPVRRRLVQGRPPWNRLQDSSSPEVIAHHGAAVGGGGGGEQMEVDNEEDQDEEMTDVEEQPEDEDEIMTDAGDGDDSGDYQPSDRSSSAHSSEYESTSGYQTPESATASRFLSSTPASHSSEYMAADYQPSSSSSSSASSSSASSSSVSSSSASQQSVRHPSSSSSASQQSIRHLSSSSSSSSSSGSQASGQQVQYSGHPSALLQASGLQYPNYQYSGLDSGSGSQAGSGGQYESEDEGQETERPPEDDDSGEETERQVTPSPVGEWNGARRLGRIITFSDDDDDDDDEEEENHQAPASSGNNSQDSNEESAGSSSDATATATYSSSKDNNQEKWNTFQFKVLALARRVVPDLGFVTVQRLSGGSYNRVASIEVNGQPRYIARMPRLGEEWESDQATKVRMDLAPLAFLQRHTSIPAPRVIRSSTSSDNPIGQPYMIMNRLYGDCLNKSYIRQVGQPGFEQQDRINLARELGAAYKEMLRITNPFPGHIVFPDEIEDPNGATDQIVIAPFNQFLYLGVDTISTRNAKPWDGNAPPQKRPRDVLIRWLKNTSEWYENQADIMENEDNPKKVSKREEDLWEELQIEDIRREMHRLEQLDQLQEAQIQQNLLNARLAEIKARKESYKAELEQKVQDHKDMATLTDWFRSGIKSIDKLGFLPGDMPNVLVHTDMAHRNLVYNRTAGRNGQPGLGILDWDDSLFLPAFMACRPPAFIWSDEHDADFWHEVLDNIPLNAEQQQIKDVFDEAAGPDFVRYAYEPVYKFAREFMRTIIQGMDGFISGLVKERKLDRASALTHAWRKKLDQLEGRDSGDEMEE